MRTFMPDDPVLEVQAGLQKRQHGVRCALCPYGCGPCGQDGDQVTLEHHARAGIEVRRLDAQPRAVNSEAAVDVVGDVAATERVARCELRVVGSRLQ